MVIYVDPLELTTSPKDATLILVSHDHSDRYFPGDISQGLGPPRKFIGAAGVVAEVRARAGPRSRRYHRLPKVRIIGVASFNTNKTNHPKASNWLGFIV